MTPTLTAPDPAVFPADVRAFAAQRGVTEYLVPLYELAQRCFPGADVAVTFESDYEIPDLHWIVFTVVRNPSAAPTDRTEYYHYVDERIRLLPPAARAAFAARVR